MRLSHFARYWGYEISMKVAYLIDKESLGGGCEYIVRKMTARQANGDECRVFYSDRGECTSAKIDAWVAEEIIVNHLKALVQLLGNPFSRPKGRVTFVVHGIHLRKYVWRSLSYWLRRGLETYLYHRCDRIVALTESDKADILRWYGRGLKVEIEPNTLEGWVPNPTDELPPGATGSFDYICIGRFDYQKGQARWIRALRGRTLFIGDGPTREACEALARKLGVAEQCVFVGAIPEAERYLKYAPVVVSPSRWEGMPYLMMKARALGCRILATDCPGNRDVLVGYEKWEVLTL